MLLMKHGSAIIRKPLSYRAAFLIVLAIAIAIRCVLLIMYGAVYQTQGDDVDYRNTALNILEKGFILGQGVRPPFYPSMLAALWFLFGDHAIVVVCVQMVFGIMTALLWTHIMWFVTKSSKVALATGLATTFFLPAVTLELRLLTEPSSLLLFALVSLFFLNYHRNLSPSNMILCSLFSFLLSLTRISYIFFCLVPCTILFFNQIGTKRSIKLLVLPICILLFQGLLSIITVLGINQRITGDLHLTTLSGGSLSGMVCRSMEVVQPESQIKEIYLRYRTIQYEKYGNCEQTIWNAYPEIIRKTGLSNYQISDALRAMSVSVIKQKPNTYFAALEDSVSKFIFTTPIYTNGTLYKILFIPLQYIIMFIFSICIGIAINIYGKFSEDKIILSTYFMWGALSFIYTLATHTLFSAGDIGRYRYTINIIPYSIIFITLWMIDKLKKRNAA